MFDSLIVQGASFTAAAILIIALSLWWMYFSPVKMKIETVVQPRPASAARTAALLGLAAVIMVIGALWDASMHVSTGTVPGGSDFLWPPHILLYSGFFISWLVAITSILEIAVDGRRQGLRDPRQWVRRNPYLGAVVLASFYSLAAIPGDAIWHELFGVDLTAWSPPHLMLAISNATVLICAVGLLVQVRPHIRAPRRVDLGVMALLALMLNFAYLVGVLEWELPLGRSPFVEARPIWAYPLVGGAVALFAFLLAKRLTKGRWAATITALIFYGVRISIAIGLDLTGNAAPYNPLAFLLGAILLDVIPWAQIRSHMGRAIGTALAYTGGYALLALPLLALRGDLRAFTPEDIFVTLAVTLAASLALQPLARWASLALLGAPAKSAG